MVISNTPFPRTRDKLKDLTTAVTLTSTLYLGTAFTKLYNIRLYACAHNSCLRLERTCWLRTVSSFCIQRAYLKSYQMWLAMIHGERHRRGSKRTAWKVFSFIGNASKCYERNWILWDGCYYNTNKTTFIILSGQQNTKKFSSTSVRINRQTLLRYTCSIILGNDCILWSKFSSKRWCCAQVGAQAHKPWTYKFGQNTCFCPRPCNVTTEQRW